MQSTLCRDLPGDDFSALSPDTLHLLELGVCRQVWSVLLKKALSGQMPAMAKALQLAHTDGHWPKKMALRGLKRKNINMMTGTEVRSLLWVRTLPVLLDNIHLLIFACDTGYSCLSGARKG